MMSETMSYPEWQLKPARLSKEEIADPLKVIVQFLNDRCLPEHRSIIWDMLQASLASSNCEFIDGKEAAEWVSYCRDLESFIEAVFVLAGNLEKAEPV